MQVTSLTRLTKGRSKVCLDKGTDFVLYKGEISQYDIAEGSFLSDSQYQAIVTEILIPRCKKRGLYLLQKQDRTEANLRSKLKEGGYPEPVIDEAIAYIASFGYIDDERYAASYIRFYQASKSKQRIKQDLMAKGVSGDIIESCLESEYEEDELDMVLKLLAKKKYDSETATYQDKAKLYRFLAGRGFSSDTIKKALDL